MNDGSKSKSGPAPRTQTRAPGAGSAVSVGKNARTARLPPRASELVQRKATQTSGAAADPPADVKSSGDWTSDSWMDTAHRGQAAGGVVQRSGQGSVAASPGAAMDSATSGGGSEIPHRATMESAFGQDFSGVKAHTGKSAEMDSIGANAAARGESVAFKESSPSAELVAHELTHVVQSRQSGASSGVAASSAVSSPSSAAEREADTLAPRAARGEAVTVHATPSADIHRDTTTTPPSTTTAPATGGGSATGATPTGPAAPVTGAPSGAPSIDQQVTDALSRNDEAALRALATTQANIEAIIRVSLAQNRGALLVSLPHGGNAALWNQSMGEAQYTQSIDQSPAQIQRQDQYNGVWILYGNGDRRTAAAARTTFSKLYTAQILAPGSTDAWWPGGTTASGTTQWEWRTIYMPVTPDDNTMKGFLTGVRTLPQGQVNMAKIAFVAQTQQQYKQIAPTAGAWTNYGSPANIGTSYYLDNCNAIVIQSDASGSSAGNMTAIGQTSDGTALAVGGATGGPALTFFLNHARHEVGHAVGNRQLQGTAEKGDDFAKTYGGWAQSDRGALKTATWTASGTVEVTINGASAATKHNLDADAVAEWLIGCMENENEPAGNAVTAIAATTAAKVAGIAAAFPGQALLQYFRAVYGVNGGNLAGMKNSAYMYPGYTPSSDPIIWASRCNPMGWWKYSKGAHDALRSALGWYSMASWREMFAEIYTHRYSGGAFPAAVNGKDPKEFFRTLEASSDSGLIPSADAAGTAMASTAPTPPSPTPPAPLPTGGGGAP